MKKAKLPKKLPKTPWFTYDSDWDLFLTDTGRIASVCPCGLRQFFDLPMCAKKVRFMCVPKPTPYSVEIELGLGVGEGLPCVSGFIGSREPVVALLSAGVSWMATEMGAPPGVPLNIECEWR